MGFYKNRLNEVDQAIADGDKEKAKKIMRHAFRESGGKGDDIADQLVHFAKNAEAEKREEGW